MRTGDFENDLDYLWTATGAEATGALMGAPPDLPTLEPMLEPPPPPWDPAFTFPPDQAPMEPDEYEGGGAEPR